MKKIIIIYIFLLFSTNIFSQEAETSLVKWYTIEEGFKLYKENPKPIILDVYTDWCGWCKHMMATTFSNSGIANYINTNFYPIRFDAETHDTIIYNDLVYTNRGKTHDLAIKLLNNQLSYPTTVFFDKKGNPNNVPGYLDIQDIEPLLVFFVEDVNSYATFQDFNVAYMFAFPNNFKDKIAKLSDSQKIDTLGVVKWITFEEAEKLNKITPKPYFIDIYVSWWISCKVLKNAIYKNFEIAKYLNDNFYCISFDAASTAPITIKGTTYTSLGAGQPHQLAMTILQGRFIFPTTVFFNSNFELINVVNGFFSAAQLEPIINYFGSESYKTIEYPKYYEKFESKL